ncbi:MAG: hypothetical protein WB930_20040 [Syntrophobacteraceae bacterium]
MTTKETGEHGEHLLTAKLERLGSVKRIPGRLNLLTVHSPDIKIKVRFNTIQKEKSKYGWQFHVDKFLDMDFNGDCQVIKGKLPKMDYGIHVLILIDKDGKETYYVLQQTDLQEHIYKNYSKFIKDKQGRRPNNPRSTHCYVRPQDIETFRDNWDLVSKQPHP